MTTARTQVSLYKSIERYGYLHGNRDDTEATAAEIMRDFIVIPRSDLPDVTDHHGWLTAINGTQSDSATTSNEPDQLRRKALNLLAIAEHLENAVDEAQVNALARLVAAETNGTHIAATALARRLIQAGVRMDGAK